MGTSARAAKALFSRSLARRPGQPAHDRRVRQSAAAAAARSHAAAWRSSRSARRSAIARRLERARRDEPERPQLVDAGRQLRRSRRRCRTAISSACRTACSATRAATPRRWRRWPTRRATSGRCSPTTSGRIAATSPSSYGAQLRALRLPGRRRRCFSPRVSATFIADRRRGACAPRRRATSSAPGAEEFLPPTSRRVPAAAAHVLAALEGGHPHAGAAELRGRRRARPERRDDRGARVRAAHRRSNRDGVRPAAQDDAAVRSVTTTSARPAMRTCAASASRSRTRSPRTFAARSITRSPPRTGPSDRAGRVRRADAMGAVGGAPARPSASTT